MDKKDKLGLELKSIMDEDTKDISLSPYRFDKILAHRKKGIKEKIKELLNKEVEIPLTPALIVFTAFLIITTVPKDIFKNQEVEIIDIGSSQLVIRERQVSRR